MSKRTLATLIHGKGGARPIGNYSQSWVDSVHEGDGGYDLIGPKPQDGRDMLERELMVLRQNGGEQSAWDDVTGAELDPDLVKAARAEEMAYFKAMNAFERVPRSKIEEVGGKVVSTRWIDINKGDTSSPQYRSRLVGREYNNGKDDSLYASTPPIESLRMVLSYAATISPDDGLRHSFMVNDVSRAYFYAPARRNLFMELPPEDSEAQEGQVGWLNVSRY